MISPAHGISAALPRRYRRRVRVFLTLAAALLQGCVFLPRSEVVYHEKCELHYRQLTLEAHVGQFPASCSGKDCGYLLVALGLVAAGSALVSGSIVVTGNAIYWTEMQRRCRLA
jgi:hypothetical protein